MTVESVSKERLSYLHYTNIISQLGLFAAFSDLADDPCSLAIIVKRLLNELASVLWMHHC